MKTKIGVEILALAWRRRWVHALVPILILTGAGKVTGQNGQKDSMETPTFFTNAYATGTRIQTRNEQWRANPFVDERVIAAIETVNDDEYFTGTSSMAAFSTPYRDSLYYRKVMLGILLDILSDPKTHKLAKGCVAFYLGIMRAPEAAASLAAIITNTVPVVPHKFSLTEGPPFGSYEPVGDALVAIGTPAIPAVIRNLTESDDPKVRELSLKVLDRIESDKDIVQLRLHKALAAQSDVTKQSRLKLALKLLADNQAGK